MNNTAVSIRLRYAYSACNRCRHADMWDRVFVVRVWSVTYSAHQIAAEVIRYHRLSAPVWIEHYPTEATDGTSETFELVVFSSYTVKERAPYLGETRLPIGEPTWKTLDREIVETLVGQEL